MSEEHEHDVESIGDGEETSNRVDSLDDLRESIQVHDIQLRDSDDRGGMTEIPGLSTTVKWRVIDEDGIEKASGSSDPSSDQR